MAIGVGKLFGYSLSVNFSRPYYSTSFRDFWHRWNITLGTWLRDYIYIPLGGNRLPGIKWGIIILLVFIISGLWHGSTLPFIVWGLCHGSLLIAERTLKPKTLSLWLQGVYSTFVFFIVSLLWQLFIVDSMESALQRYECLFVSQRTHYITVLQVLICGLSYVVFTSKKVFGLIQHCSENKTIIVCEVTMLTLMLSVLIMFNCSLSFNFFYFRF